MTTEKKPENTEKPAASDNKAVFAPLGKYAIIAVIMVSIIVTTAIMLDKQLNHVNQEIAAIEMEVAEMHMEETANTSEASIIEKEVTTESALVTNDSTIAETTSVEAAAAVETTITETKAVEAELAEVKVIEPSTADVLIEKNTQTSVAEMDSNDVPEVSSAQFEMVTISSQVQNRQQQLALDNQTRIESYKTEHKKNLSEMFARIKTLEAQQLDRYKSNQNDQITRLREQITHQQQMIEALVLRNKDLFELRSTNMQRNQANREQVLNRI